MSGGHGSSLRPDALGLRSQLRGIYPLSEVLWVLLSPLGSVQFFHVSWALTGCSCLVTEESEMPATVKLTIWR